MRSGIVAENGANVSCSGTSPSCSSSSTIVTLKQNCDTDWSTEYTAMDGPGSK